MSEQTTLELPVITLREVVMFPRAIMTFHVGRSASVNAINSAVTENDKRIFAINVQGITGKKMDFTSLPYKNIQAYSVETAGVLDLDTELDLWFSGLGKIRLEFVAQENIAYICKMISENVL